MNTEEHKDFLRFIKKRYDNSFYPATYNIERNCLEYPNMPNIFYWPNGFVLPKEFRDELIKSMIKEFSDKYGIL